MKDIKALGLRQHVRDLEHVKGDGIGARWIEPDGPLAWRDESRHGARVAASEERDVVPTPNEFFGQPRDNAFGPAVETRWNTFVKRRDLRDSHALSTAKLVPATGKA
jgi:hypothetical protein